MNIKQHKLLLTLPGSLEANSIYHVRNSRGEIEVYLTNDLGAVVAYPVVSKRFIQQFSGEFLLDPNEYNGWTTQGWIDETARADLGDVGDTNLTRTAAGFMFPFDVKLIGSDMWLSQSTAGANPWGLTFFFMTKTDNSSARATTFLRDEAFDRGVGHFGLREYLNTSNQFVSLGPTDFVDVVIPAGSVVSFAVGAPTADTTNNYVRIQSGFLEFERA